LNKEIIKMSQVKNCFGWDYEEGDGIHGYYHIWATEYDGELVLDDESLCLFMPESNQNESLVNEIISTLNELASYNYYEIGQWCKG